MSRGPSAHTRSLKRHGFSTSPEEKLYAGHLPGSSQTLHPTRPERPSEINRLIYNFEDFSLDIDRQELRRGADLVAVEPQVLDLLQ